MTKSEIEKLIEYIDNRIEKRVLEDYVGVHHRPVVCSVNDLYDLLRNYPVVESDKTAGPDYKAMYEECAAALEKAQARAESVMFDLKNLSREHDRYVGAVAIIETVTGRKFEPDKCGGKV